MNDVGVCSVMNYGNIPIVYNDTIPKSFIITHSSFIIW